MLLPKKKKKIWPKTNQPNKTQKALLQKTSLPPSRELGKHSNMYVPTMDSFSWSLLLLKIFYNLMLLSPTQPWRWKGLGSTDEPWKPSYCRWKPPCQRQAGCSTTYLLNLNNSDQLTLCFHYWPSFHWILMSSHTITHQVYTGDEAWISEGRMGSSLEYTGENKMSTPSKQPLPFWSFTCIFFY